MNFYPPPPTIKAEVWLRIPDDKRCIGQDSEWRGGFAGSFKHIFLEGPVFDSVGNLYVVDIPYGRILKIDKDKNVLVACTWDGEPNGLVGSADGDLLVADYKQGILSFNPETGKMGPKLTRKNLERFKGPNDLIIDSKGNLYFTDQGQTGMTDPTGRVYRLSPDGRLDTLLDNGPSPNGLVLSRDERFLYVAMTRANQVWRLPLHPDGTTSKAGVFFQSFGNAGPDGLALDEEGNLFICHPSLGPMLAHPSHRYGRPSFTNKIPNTTVFVISQRDGEIMSIRGGGPGATPKALGVTRSPLLYIIAKGSPRILLPICMLAWSCVTICIPTVTSGWGFCLCRFIIRLVEGPFVPAVSLMTSSWYTKHESPLRMGVWHAGNTISQALSGLLAAGILTNMEGVADLRAWKWFLLLEGAVSILVAIVSFWFIPNFPDSTGTYFITEEEAAMAQYRQAVDAGGISEDDSGDYWSGFWMLQISWETTVVPRPRTKRAALIAYANCVSSVSHWFTPYFFLRNQEPYYQTGGGAIIAGCGLTVIFVLIAKWYVAKKNKALKSAEDSAGEPVGWRYAG
ncbi:Ff.00g066200.m01.CDS01 [Fusarium sp. VM40]|nr:Ff.00g066200.m01.CDS01 [Fusarium sp. VM40]